jgi:hypothetical protein
MGPAQVVVDMAGKIGRIHKDDDPEKISLKQAVADLRLLITDQGIPPAFNAPESF